MKIDDVTIRGGVVRVLRPYRDEEGDLYGYITLAHTPRRESDDGSCVDDAAQMTYHQVEVRGELLERLSEIQKGDHLIVVGSLVFRNRFDRDGVRRQVQVLRAETMAFDALKQKGNNVVPERFQISRGCSNEVTSDVSRGPAVAAPSATTGPVELQAQATAPRM